MSSPWRTMSSPVFTIAVTAVGSCTATSPRSSRAAPTPPPSPVITAPDATGPSPAPAALGRERALGSAVAAWKHFGRPGESAQQLARRFITATALRWVTMLAVLYLAVARLALPPGAVLSGLVAGLAVYVFALRWE